MVCDADVTDIRPRVLQFVGSEDLTAVTMNSTAFWVVTPCSSEKVRPFGGTYRLYFQGLKVSQSIGKEIYLPPAYVDLLLGLVTLRS
jgi:hypothetical protein